MPLPSLLEQSIAVMEGEITLSNFLRSQGIDQIRGWAPAVDIDESTSVLLVKIIIAGVEDEDLDINFYNNILKIGGIRNRNLEEDFVSIKGEITYGSFEREIILPISVTSRESVNIETKNGIIYIKIDKTREEKNRFSVHLSTPQKNQSVNSDQDTI